MVRPAKPTFMAEPVYEKVGACEYGQKYDADVMSACSPCTRELPSNPATSDATSVASAFNNFSSSHKKRGQFVSLDNDEFLGHVKLLSDTATFLAAVLEDDAERIERRFQALAGLISTTSEREARRWFERKLVNRPLSKGGPLAVAGPVCWLFRSNGNETPPSLLANSDASEVPCRLGLPAFLNDKSNCPPLEFVGFVTQGNKVKNQGRPTVFDGDYVSVRDLWGPDGFTRPIAWAPAKILAKGGFPEIVADAPLYDAIETDIYVFQSFSFTK